ncbi:MAG TPA: protein kinase [Anaerolineales bacterium]|nr:protein kinase [Anaerolineales bacterium]
MLTIHSILADRYRILQVIAQGGQGRVYLAADTRLSERRVAVKELLINEATQTRAQAAINFFKTEASMLAQLRHPNLPVIFDYFTSGENTYLVMEYIEGKTLANLMSESPLGLPENQVRDWANQLIDVINFLHAQNPPIIFRDLKPANIMLDKHGHIKLIDFGIARVFKEVRGPSQDTIIAGTPGYLPPEQYGNSQTDARSDLYALAVTLLVLLTGIEPGHYGFQLPPVRSLRPDVSQQMESALNGALRFDPAQRFSTVRHFGEILNGNTAHASAQQAPTQLEPTYATSTVVRPNSPATEQRPYTPTPKSTSWLWLALPLGIAAVACVGILYFGLPTLQAMFGTNPDLGTQLETAAAMTVEVAFAQTNQAQPEAQASTPAPLSNPTATHTPLLPSPTPPTPSATPSPTEDLSLSAVRNGYIVFDAIRGGDEDIYIMNGDGSDERPLVTEPGNQQEADISSNGKVVAFNWQVDNAWEIWTIEVDGSNLNKVPISQPSPRLPAWHPSQPILAFEAGGQLWVYGSQGGNTAQLTNGNPHRAANWSPDGKKIVCMTQVDGTWQISVVNVETGVETLITTDAGDKRHPNWSPDGRWLVYNTLRPDGNPDQIFRIPAEGGKPEQMTAEGLNGRPVYAPNGKLIVFNSDRDGYWLLYSMLPDGSNQQKLTRLGNTQRPDWGVAP